MSEEEVAGVEVQGREGLLGALDVGCGYGDGRMDALGRMSAVCKVRDLSSSSALVIGIFDQLQWWTLSSLFPIKGIPGHLALGYILEAASCC